MSTNPTPAGRIIRAVVYVSILAMAVTGVAAATTGMAWLYGAFVVFLLAPAVTIAVLIQRERRRRSRSN